MKSIKIPANTDKMKTPFTKMPLILILCMLASLSGVRAQGCSDAGFCTMGAMKPGQDFNKKIPVKLRSLELNFYRGTSTLTPVIYVATLDFSFSLKEKTDFQLKLPYQYVSGNFGSAGGLGDISISMTRLVFSSENLEINATIGTKLPSNNSNIKNFDAGFGRDYPMYYQISLGSFDLIAGISLISDKWLVATGIQAALTRNENYFRWNEWNDYPNPEYVREYPLSKELKRGTDIMLRVERNFRYGRWTFNAGILPIFRITKDEILNEATSEREKLDGTTGMALSALVGGGYQFDVNSGIKIILGRKITQREVNPDGLTREVVTSLSYVYRF